MNLKTSSSHLSQRSNRLASFTVALALLLAACSHAPVDSRSCERQPAGGSGFQCAELFNSADAVEVGIARERSDDVSLEGSTVSRLSDEIINKLARLGISPAQIYAAPLAHGKNRIPQYDSSLTLSDETVQVSEVFFMQDSASLITSDSRYTVLDNALNIREGKLDIASMPKISVWKDTEGKIWTLDHRRLISFVLAGVKKIGVTWAKESQVKQQRYKFTTHDAGESIALKLDPGIYILVRPDRNQR